MEASETSVAVRDKGPSRTRIWSISPRMYSPLWNCRGLHFFYYTLSFGDDLICVQIWMGMVSFLISPVGGTFWWKKMNRFNSKGCLF